MDLLYMDTMTSTSEVTPKRRNCKAVTEILRVGIACISHQMITSNSDNHGLNLDFNVT